MAYYAGFQRNMAQRNAFQLVGGGVTPPTPGGGDWYIIQRRRRRYAWIAWLVFLSCMAPGIVS